MRPMKLRSHLLLLTLGTLLPIVVFAAIAGWMLLVGLQDSSLDATETVWLMGAGVAAGIALALLLAAALARKIASPITSLAAATKALVSGARFELPRAVRIREIAEAAEALDKAAAAVRSREAAARDAERAKDEFLAMLSHELRNPLATLASAAYLLRRSAADAASGQAADTVSRQVQHMTRLIEDLLDLSRITKGKLSLSRRPLDLAQVARQAVEELRAAGRLEQHRIQLELEPAWARADEARIEQIAANLIGNALKNTPENGEIAISVRRARDSVLLSVRDSGVGMAPELAARVFDLFVQGEREHGRGGLGIGLALVKQLAELHGGSAAAVSAGLGRGAEFIVSLPAIEAPAEQAAPPPPARKATRGGHRILLIEDHDDTRRNLCAALALDGHQVREAADGNAAIRSAAEFNPEVAIIDVGLPGPNGFQVAQTLRGASGTPIVLIALTGYTQPDALRRAREAGFDEYVTKPIAPERLSRLIEATLARRRDRPAPTAA
jgi:signal transduction histidine kinase/ActR/RegA family two-component response regulator